MELHTAFLFLCVCMLPISVSEVLQKCCGRGEILDSSYKNCVRKSGSPFSLQVLDHFLPPIDNKTIYWLPEQFRNSNITVLYSIMSMESYDLAYTLAFDTESEFRIEDDWGVIETVLIKREWFCFDETQDPNRPRVAFKGVSIQTINKCCGRDEILNSRGDACVKVREHTVNDTWIPTILYHSNHTHLLSRIRKNFLDAVFQFNQLLKVTDGLEINFIPAGIHFTGKTVSGVLSEGATDIFCFDILQEENGTFSQVLLAAVYQLNKCCPKGEYLLNWVCTRYPGVTVKRVKNEVIDWREDEVIHEWIPKSFRLSNISVLYDARYKQTQNMRLRDERSKPATFIFHENQWKIELGNNSLPSISGNISLLNGAHLTLSFTLWCIEKLNEYFILVVGDLISTRMIIRKCCDPGEIFSSEGYCEKHEGENWSPKISSVRDSFKHLGIPEENIPLARKYSCPYEPYTTHSLQSAAALRYYKGLEDVTTPLGTVSHTYHCLDFQKTNQGTVKEVLGSCTDPPNAFTYSSARPVLGLATGIVFVAAAGVALARVDTRRSAHGRALACFALSQGAANALQVTSFFMDDMKLNPCVIYGYMIYFFMVSANLWLTAITFNMVTNFRKPLGALAKAPTARSVWRRFGIMAAFSWGLSTGFTVFTIIMYINQLLLRTYGIITPTFTETRSCGVELDFSTLQWSIDLDLASFGHPLGPLCYYFIPMLLLVVVNTTSVVLTVRRIRHLGKDSAFAKSAGSGNSALNDVLLYVKLMITTGFVELIMEVSAWATQSNQRPASGIGPFFGRAYTFRLIAISIDLVRAICTFWLCMGTWCRMGTLWSHARAVLGRVPHVASNARNRCLQFVRKRNDGETVEIPMAPVNNTEAS